MDGLDKTDRAILAIVQRDGRIAVSKLAEGVSLSETACARRLKRLETEGYISDYRAMLSRRAMGLGVTAFAQVRFSSHNRALSDKFEREVLTHSRIVACHNISGSADYLLQVVARDLEAYGAFVRDVIRTMPGVTSVESMLALQEIKRDTGLPIT